MAEDRIDCYGWVPRTGPFKEELLYIHPDDVRSTRRLSARKPDQPPRICVIGGGAAGLTAAYELAARNCEVTLLEASSRFGGRVETWYFADETYSELGAMRIPKIHGCVMHYIRKLGLNGKKKKFTQFNGDALLALRGERVPYRRWRALRPVYERPLTSHQPAPLRERAWVWRRKPSTALDELVEQMWRGDEAEEAGWAFFDTDLASPQARLADQLTLWQSLCAVDVVNRPPYATVDGFPPISDETWAYLRRATASAGVEQATLMEAIVDSFPFAKSSMWRLDGGMDELIRAFVDAIPRVGHGELRQQSAVTHIAVTEGGVSVHWREGSPGGRPRKGDFDYAICAVPAPCVQRIQFYANRDPNSRDREEALASISYGSAAKTLIHVRRRLWEKPPQPILGGASFTDMPIQQVWYPSDGAEEVIPDDFADAQDSGDDDPLPISYRVVELEADPPDDLDPAMREYARRASASGFDHPLRQPASWERAGVLTAAYIWGSGARRLAVLSEADRSRVVLDALERLHPGIREEVDQPPVHRIWDCELNPGDGAYALFAPGEARRYQTALIEPIRDGSGTARVYFAGEHLAIAHGWIQSAMQSALACVMHLLDAL